MSKILDREHSLATIKRPVILLHGKGLSHILALENRQLESSDLTMGPGTGRMAGLMRPMLPDGHFANATA
jgi:hypothetical protein